MSSRTVTPSTCSCQPLAFYDHPLHPEQSHLGVCEEFLRHLRSGSLLGCRCFHGECPSYADPETVCARGSGASGTRLTRPRSLEVRRAMPTCTPPRRWETRQF